MDNLMHYLMLCAATAMCAMTISKMKVAGPLHDLAAKLGQVWLQDLLTCPYCLSVWFGLFWVVVTQSVTGVVSTALMSLAVAAGAVVFGGAMYRIMMLHEKEVYGIKEALKRAREELGESREAEADAKREVVRLSNSTRHWREAATDAMQHREPHNRFSTALPDPRLMNGFTPPRPMPPAPAPIDPSDPFEPTQGA